MELTPEQTGGDCLFFAIAFAVVGRMPNLCTFCQMNLFSFRSRICYSHMPSAQERRKKPRLVLMAWPLLIPCATNQEIRLKPRRTQGMQREKQAVATLGDLIAAVTDEVSPLTNNPTKTNVLVSYILNDLFVTKRVRFRQGRVANARFGR